MNHWVSLLTHVSPCACLQTNRPFRSPLLSPSGSGPGSTSCSWTFGPETCQQQISVRHKCTRLLQYRWGQSMITTGSCLRNHSPGSMRALACQRRRRTPSCQACNLYCVPPVNRQSQAQCEDGDCELRHRRTYTPPSPPPPHPPPPLQWSPINK